MNLAKISAGRNPPYDVNVIVEIPQGSALVKYEFDNESGAFFVDRFFTPRCSIPAITVLSHTR